MMTKALRTTFLIHAIVGAIAGAVLLLIPGRFLTWIGWAPIDPIASRLLGAAMLALALGSWRGWQAADRANVAILVQVDAAFTLLACVGLLRHILAGSWPAVVWVIFGLFAAFAIAWLFFLVQRGK